MKKNLSLIALIAATLIVSSCASNKVVETKIDQEIKDVPASETKSIAKTIKEQITASALTEEQKTKLMALEEKAHADHVAITEEIEKTKVVFIQTVLAPKMNQREYSVLKKKLTDLDRKRLSNGFKVAAEVRKIINPASNTHEKEIYKAVIENRLRGF